MGSAVGAAYSSGGARVVATVDGRGARTRGLAAAAGLELLPELDDVVRHADVVLSIVPPEHALVVADEIGASARRVDSDPLVADLNAIAPGTARELARRLAGSGLDYAVFLAFTAELSRYEPHRFVTELAGDGSR